MSNYNFGEKASEYYGKTGEEIPVWQTPKYKEARAKAVEILDSGLYGLKASDFWILMNAIKNGKKMAYTGLIISHNGCLKINDSIQQKFDPASVQMDKEGYNGSLVYSYCNAAQGIYEVGEVSKANCKIDYPYAMAFKRLFDRVVLKLSKLAYSGIYSENESDEFGERLSAVAPEEPAPDATPTEEKPLLVCTACHKLVDDDFRKDGSPWPAAEIAEYSQRAFGRIMCKPCQKEELKRMKAAAKAGETA